MLQARAEYLRKKRKDDAAYAGLSRGVMQKALAGEDAFDALVSTMVMVEERETFARLPVLRDSLPRLEGWTWAPGPARTARVNGQGLGRGEGGGGDDGV